MYKVELLKNDTVILSKKFEKYDLAVDYAFHLLDLLKLKKEIRISQKYGDDWKIIKKFSLKK